MTIFAEWIGELSCMNILDPSIIGVMLFFKMSIYIKALKCFGTCMSSVTGPWMPIAPQYEAVMRPLNLTFLTYGGLYRVFIGRYTFERQLTSVAKHFSSEKTMLLNWSSSQVSNNVWQNAMRFILCSSVSLVCFAASWQCRPLLFRVRKIIFEET